MRHEEDVLPRGVARTGRGPHGRGEDAARNRVLGDAVLADERRVVDLLPSDRNLVR